MSETSPHFVAVCPSCLVSLRVKYEYSGSHVRCKHCNQKFRALAPDFPATPASFEEYTTGPVVDPSFPAERLALNCPHCSAPLSIRRAFAGQHVRCKSCEQKFLVPNIVESNLEIPKPPTEVKSSALDLFDQLYHQLDESSTGDLPRTDTAAIAKQGEELKRVSEERDQLRAAHEALIDQLAQARSTGEQAHAELQRLRAEHDQVQQDRQQIAAQFASIGPVREESGLADAAQWREQIQTLQSELSARSEAENLRAQHEEALRADNEKLSDQVETLKSELAEQGEVVSQLAQRDQELRAAHVQLAQLSQQLQRLESAATVQTERDLLGQQFHEVRTELDSVLAERDQLTTRARELQAQLGAAHAECEQLSERIEQGGQSLRAAEARIEELGERLRQRDDEQSARDDEFERLNAERLAAINAAERLRATLAEREHQFRTQSEGLEERIRHGDEKQSARDDELERLIAERRDAIDAAERLRATLTEREQKFHEQTDQIRRDVEALRDAKEQAELAHREAHDHLRSELAQARSELEEARNQWETTHTQSHSLRAHADELQGRFDRVSATHQEALESERSRLAAEIQSAIESERSRHAQELAEHQARARESNQIAERLRAEILTLAEARSVPDADLEAAQLEITDLRKQLSEIETTKRSMSSLLEGMGIRLH